jgi:RNA polymerase sigma-70 factor (ECF subfamily)
MKETYRDLVMTFQRNKSEIVFNKLYAKIKPGLTNYVYNIVKSSQAAEDVVADTLSKLYTHIDKYDPAFEVTTWIYRIARNSAIQFNHQQKSKVSLDEFKEWGFDVTESSSGGMVVKHYTESNTNEDFFSKTEKDCIEEFDILLKRNTLVIEVIKGLKIKYRDIMEDRFINKLSYQMIVDKNNDPINQKINHLLDEILCVDSIDEKKKIYFNIEKVKKELITLQTIKNRINRGRKKVQDILSKHPLFKVSNK